jgi:hypothetical protein
MVRMTIDQLTRQVLDLTVAQRAELAELLLASLEEAEPDGVLDEWLKVGERRANEIELGEATGRPAAQVIADVRTRLGR